MLYTNITIKICKSLRNGVYLMPAQSSHAREFHPCVLTELPIAIRMNLSITLSGRELRFVPVHPALHVLAHLCVKALCEGAKIYILWMYQSPVWKKLRFLLVHILVPPDSSSNRFPFQLCFNFGQ